MQKYNDKDALFDEIRKTAALCIKNFEEIDEADKNVHYDGVDRTPQEIIA